MSRQPRTTNSAVTSVAERSSDLVDDYTAQLDTFANGLLPPFLDNAEYAARTSALMIALNRQLARCAAAFGEVHGVSPTEMVGLVASQFDKNFRMCLDAVQGEGVTVQ